MKKEEGRERDGCLGVVGMMGRGASSPLRHPPYATLPSNTAFSGIILVLGRARGAAQHKYDSIIMQPSFRRVIRLDASCSLAEGRTWN